MSVQGIVDGLDRSAATGREAGAIARATFLYWVVTQPGTVSGAAARAALDELAGRRPRSDAARAFIEILWQATPEMRPEGRRGGRVRRAVQ